jgi:hypothetical protein
VIALVVLAARLARGRERVVVLALAAGALVVLPVALQSLSFRFTGFGLQARHFLGFAVAVPLLAGDIVTRHAMQLDARVRRVLPLAAGTVAGVVQFGAWWFYARRSAVGVDGPFAFLGKAEWTPWAGWGLWLAFALVGSLLLAAAPLLSRRLEQRPRGG